MQPINLNRARKARAKAQAKAEAAANRAKHGRPKAQKAAERLEAEKARRELDGAMLDTPSPPGTGREDG